MALIFISKRKFEQEISKRATEFYEQMIIEMGAELHDDLIQKLSIFRLYLDRLERSENNSPETQSLLMSMRSDFERVIQSVRQIFGTLTSEHLNHQSLNKSIEALCENLEGPGFGNIYYGSIGIEAKIPDLDRTYLYRITQELIHNAFKHSAAWHIWVRVNWQQVRLIIEVEDDGCGFNSISEVIGRLRTRNNTLNLRSKVIGATINYYQGVKGLLAKIEYDF